MTGPRAVGTLGEVSEQKAKPKRMTREQALCDFVRWMLIHHPGRSSITNNELSFLWLEFADSLANKAVVKPTERERWANPFCRMSHR